MSSIITCQNCGQKNKIPSNKIDKPKCGKCGKFLINNTSWNPIILIIFPTLWILLQTKVYYYMGLAEASGGAIAILGVSIIIPLIVFAIKKFKQKPYPNFVKHTFIGTIIVFALALISYMDSHNWKFPSPAAVAYRQGNYEQSCELRVESCYAGDARNCSIAAAHYKDGKGVEKNINRAITFYDKACNDGDIETCLMIGGYYRLGSLGKKDDYISFKYYKKACESKEKGQEFAIGGSCSKVADMYKSGTGTYQSDLMASEYAQKAISILKRSCDNNNATSCESLADMYYFGRGIEIDHFKSKELFNKACKKNEVMACVMLGMQYEKGQGVKKDYEKALKYYGKACDNEFEWGCEKYSNLK